MKTTLTFIVIATLVTNLSATKFASQDIYSYLTPETLKKINELLGKYEAP